MTNNVVFNPYFLMLGQSLATHSTPMFWVTWPFCNPALIIINAGFQ